MAADCKSVSHMGRAGSNPAPPITLTWRNWDTRQAQTLLERSMPVRIRLSVFYGDLAELLIAPVLKTGDWGTDPGGGGRNPQKSLS